MSDEMTETECKQMREHGFLYDQLMEVEALTAHELAIRIRELANEQTGLDRKTGLDKVTLIVASNLLESMYVVAMTMKRMAKPT